MRQPRPSSRPAPSSRFWACCWIFGCNLGARIFFLSAVRPLGPERATPAHVTTEAVASVSRSLRAAPADLDLMRRAGSGNQDAQRILVTRLMGRAGRLAQALLR